MKRPPGLSPPPLDPQQQLHASLSPTQVLPESCPERGKGRAADDSPPSRTKSTQNLLLLSPSHPHVLCGEGGRGEGGKNEGRKREGGRKRAGREGGEGREEGKGRKIKGRDGEKRERGRKRGGEG